MEVIAYNRLNNFDQVLVCAALLKAIAVLAIPAALCLLFGESFVKYLKGELSKESKGLVGLMDISGTTSFIGRFAAQMMRYLFMLAKMYLYVLVAEVWVVEWRAAGGPGPYYLLDNYIIVGVFIDIFELFKRFLGLFVDFGNVFFVLYAQIGALLIVI